MKTPKTISDLLNEVMAKIRSKLPQVEEGQGFLPGDLQEKLTNFGSKISQDISAELEYYEHLKKLIDEHGKIPEHRSIDDE